MFGLVIENKEKMSIFFPTKKNNECKKNYLSSFPNQNEEFENSENEEKNYRIKKGKYLKFTPMFACNNHFNYCIFNLIN